MGPNFRLWPVMWALVLSLLVSRIDARNASDPYCRDTTQLSQVRCQNRIAAGCPLRWFGASCSGASDGGCRPSSYCGWSCQPRCVNFQGIGCRWSGTSCYNMFTSVGPTAAPSNPSKSPTVISLTPTFSIATMTPSSGETGPQLTNSPTSADTIHSTSRPSSSPTLSSFGRQQLAGTLCSTDADCGSFLVCFSHNRTSWVAGPEGLCGCPRTSGRTGTQCSESVGSTEFDIGLLSFFLFISLLDLIGWGRTICSFTRLIGRKTAYYQASLNSCFSASSFIIWMALSIACDVDIEAYIIMEDGSKECSLQVVQIVFGCFAVGFLLISQLDLIAIWITLAYPPCVPIHSIAARGYKLALIPLVLFIGCIVINIRYSFWAGVALFCLVVIGTLLSFTLGIRARVSLRLASQTSSNRGRVTSSKVGYGCKEWEKHYSLLGEVLIGSGLSQFFVALSFILAVASFAILDGSFAWRYEEGPWNRPSHWCFRAAQCFLLASLTVVVWHLHRLRPFILTKRHNSNAVEIFEV